MHRILREVAVLFCLLALASAVVGAAQPIRIGVSIGLSGRYAAMGGMYEKGLRLWEKDINAQGGILGRPVQLLIHDDRSSPEEAQRIYQGMLTQGDIDLVLGPYSSSISEAVASLLEKYGYPTLLPLAATDTIWERGLRYVFGMHTCGRHWTGSTFACLARNGISRVGILVNPGLYELQDPKDAAKWARLLDMKILTHEVLDMANVEKQIERNRNLGVEAFIVWGYLNEAVEVRKALEKADWYPKVFFSHIGPALQKYHQLLGPLADYTVGTSVWEPAATRLYPGGKAFLDAFLDEYHIQPSYHAAMGFAAGEVLAKAISKAGSTDHEQIRTCLSKLDVITVVGRYGVDAKGRQIRLRPLIIQWQNGEKKILAPEALCNGSLMFPPEKRP